MNPKSIIPYAVIITVLTIFIVGILRMFSSVHIQNEKMVEESKEPMKAELLIEVDGCKIYEISNKRRAIRFSKCVDAKSQILK